MAVSVDSDRGLGAAAAPAGQDGEGRCAAGEAVVDLDLAGLGIDGERAGALDGVRDGPTGRADRTH